MFKLLKKKNVPKNNEFINNLNHLPIQKSLQNIKKNLKNKCLSTQNSFLGNNLLYDGFSGSFEEKKKKNSSFNIIYNNKSKIYNLSSFSKSPIKLDISVLNEHINSLNSFSKEKLNCSEKKK